MERVAPGNSRKSGATIAPRTYVKSASNANAPATIRKQRKRLNRNR
jgi:hypothetical protein